MDDEEAVRKAIGLTLRGMGHEVELAEDGRMAVEFTKVRRACVVPLMRSSWI